MNYLIVFLFWTLCLYIVHRLIHKYPGLFRCHFDHHGFINRNGNPGWHWNNLLLFNDNWRSTADLWISEVVPTIIFSYATGHYWVFVLYYIWAAFIQEIVEHNPKINFYPWLTSGIWHLEHHKNSKCNFGLFIPIWDKIFKSEKVN